MCGGYVADGNGANPAYLLSFTCFNLKRKGSALGIVFASNSVFARSMSSGKTKSKQLSPTVSSVVPMGQNDYQQN